MFKIIWVPIWYFPNTLHLEKPQGSKDKYLLRYANFHQSLSGEQYVVFSDELRVTIACKMNFTNFPFDHQNCEWIMRSRDLTADQLFMSAILFYTSNGYHYQPVAQNESISFDSSGLTHNVEIQPGGGGKLARSAGASVTLSGIDDDYAIIKLSSGETRKVRKTCKATIGTVSNPDQKNIKIGKAGRNRWRGKRPQTRGVAMNPVDHPHGGGEGKTSGGRSPVSPWGQSAKGLKTRRPKRSDKFIITRRKKRNK